MKKMIVFVCLMLILTSVALPVNAEEMTQHEDSLSISEDTLSLLPVEDGDTIIRAYRWNDFSIAFTQYRNIDEVLSHASELYIHNFYIVREAEETTAVHWYVDGRLESSYRSAWSADLMDFHLGEMPKTIIQEISQEIVVESIYYLVSGDGNAIYYKTNLGEYVYFTFDGIGYNGTVSAGQELVGEYLLSLTQFLELQKTIRSYWENVAVNSLEEVPHIGESPQLSSSVLGVDLSVYQIGSPNFNPDAPFPAPENSTVSNIGLICGITLGVCLVAAGTLFIILRRRKRNIPA